MTAPDETGRWLIVAACCDTVTRAARLTDLQDHTGFAALFTEDAELRRPGAEVLHGRAAILASYRARPADRLTRHLVAGSVVDVIDASHARATSTVLLYRGQLDDPVGPFGRPTHGPAVVGEFDDLLRREADGCWRIEWRHAQFVLHGPPAG